MKHISKKGLMIRCMGLLLLSFFVLQGTDFFLERRRHDAYERSTMEVLRSISYGTDFERMQPDREIPGSEYVLDMYEGRGIEGEATGFVLVMKGEGVYEDQFVWLSFSPDTSSLLHVSAHSPTGEQIGTLDPAYIRSMYNIPLPIALKKDVELATPIAYPVISGLIDGTYKKESETADEEGFTDFVEIVIESGWITAVKWDAIDKATNASRAEVSLSKEEESKTPVWARQAYAMELKLVEIQDPFLIPVKSDGKTEIVSGVTIDVRMFIQLAAACVDDAKDKDAPQTRPQGGQSGQDDGNAPVVPIIPIRGVDSEVLLVVDDRIRLYGFAPEAIRSTLDGITESGDEERSVLLSVNRAFAFLTY